jgi:hypothetical protein
MRGVETIEYAVMAALIVLGVVAVFSQVGQELNIWIEGSGWPDYEFELFTGDTGYPAYWLMHKSDGLIEYKSVPANFTSMLDLVPPGSGPVEEMIYLLPEWGESSGWITAENQTDFMLPYVTESTGWLDQAGAYAYLGNATTVTGASYVKVHKDSSVVWQLGPTTDSGMEFSGTDETMMVCGRYGSISRDSTGASVSPVSVRVYDGGMIYPYMPASWTLRDGTSAVVDSDTYSDASQSVYFSSETYNCLVSTEGAASMEVTLGGATSTQTYTAGQPVSFGFVKIGDNFYVDGDLDGVPDDAGTIHAVVTSDVSGKGQDPVVGETVKAFDKSGCAADYLPKSNDVAGNCDADYSCPTDANGECDMYVPAGDYYVLVEIPDNSGKFPGHTVADVLPGETKQARLAFKSDESWIWVVGLIIVGLLAAFLFYSRSK